MTEPGPVGGDEGKHREDFAYDVFLSFASADSERAEAVVRTLREGGLRVFWAPDSEGSEPGRDFTDTIETSLVRSQHFVLFWTSQAKESGWVQAEYKAFYSQVYIRAKGTRRFVIFADGQEPISTLPLLLRNLQIARSAKELVARLGGIVSSTDSRASGPASGPATSQIPDSPSVSGALSRLVQVGDVPPFALVREILVNHREYGAGRGENVGHLPGPASGVSKPASAWLAEVHELFGPERVSRLPGRLLILGLAHLEPQLAEYLEAQDGFLTALRAELKEPFESLLLPQAKSEVPAVPPPAETPTAPPPINDPATFHLDSPAIDDRLGRRGFARALAIRLERIWREMNPQDRPSDRPVPQGSFVLHLHGPWGSGKSSILEMLRRELRPEGKTAAPTVASPWVVVDFNAWQNQRLAPPWWPLLDGIFRQSARQVPWARRWWLRACEGLWRFSTKRRDLLVFGALFLVLGFLGYRFLRPALIEQLAKGLGDMGASAGHISDIVAVLTLVTSWIWLGSRSLVSGSARAAQSFLDSATDPMDRIQRHFQTMVRTVKRPIAVFVDDLDRCQAGYVVQLLEGIQTLFRDPRVVYVIAADQRWLHACFEKTYEAFAESVREPGRRLGSLFLEKAFEISVALPELSPGVRAEYWRYLLGGDSAQAEKRLASLEQEARAEFRHDRSEQQVVARLDESQGAAEADDPLRAQARRQVAVEQLASAAVEKDVSFFLQPFAPLLEPNPRSMKRLLNAYAIRRDLAILSGLDVLGDEGRRKKLALWTILALRWPALEDFLRDKAGGDDAEPGAEVAALLASREVAEVVEGRELGGPLTLDDLKELLGFGGGNTG